MRIHSTAEERKNILRRLKSAPDTIEIRTVIRIVEEAERFAELKELINKAYSSPNSPQRFAELIEGQYINHEMRPLGIKLDELYEEIRAQRFKSFYIDEIIPGEEEWQIL